MVGTVSRSRVALAAAFLAAALALSGCSDDDPEPRSAPPASSSPASPSTTADDEGLVRDYFEAISSATSTGDTSTLEDLATPECVNCQTLVANIQHAFGEGGHVEGARWIVTALQMARRERDGTEWHVDVRTARERWFDGSGELVKVVRPSTQEFAVIVKRRSDRAVVADMRLRS